MLISLKVVFIGRQEVKNFCSPSVLPSAGIKTNEKAHLEDDSNKPAKHHMSLYISFITQ